LSGELLHTHHRTSLKDGRLCGGELSYPLQSLLSASVFKARICIADGLSRLTG
jgi:hypothetical protein